jgi:hypothetical protein
MISIIFYLFAPEQGADFPERCSIAAAKGDFRSDTAIKDSEGKRKRGSLYCFTH